MNTAHYQRHVISPRQIKAIHAAINKLSLDDPAYRSMLQTYGVSSSKQLTWLQAEELLDRLNGNTPKPASSRHRTSTRYADLDGRHGMATGAQCRMVAAMWAEVSRAENAEDRERALDSFIKRIVGVDSIRFVKGWQVEKIVKAIETMRRSMEVRND